MTDQLWINLPVNDLEKSKAFFSAIGFVPNPQGDSPVSASFKVGKRQSIIMLFEANTFAHISGRPSADTTQGCEVLLSMDVGQKSEVDAIAQKAKDAGGTVFHEPVDKEGAIYGCGFADLDGHRWNVIYMAPVAESAE